MGVGDVGLVVEDVGLVVGDVGLIVGDVGAVGLGWDDGGSADMNKD